MVQFYSCAAGEVVLDIIFAGSQQSPFTQIWSPYLQILIVIYAHNL